MVLIIITVLITALLTEMYRRLALAKQVLDLPNDRSSHSLPTVRGGGIIFAVIWLVVSHFILSDLPYYDYIVTLPAALLLFVNYYDDIFSLSAKFRMLIQMIVVIFAFGALNTAMDFSISYFLLFVFIFFSLWSINLYNFMDGLDGLAATQAVLLFSVGGSIIYFSGLHALAYSSWLLAAAVSGFLIWNFPPARLFMGDSGSAFLGMMTALFISLVYFYYEISVVPWLILYSSFMVDTTATLCRRLLVGKPIYMAHREHAYQRLHIAGWTHLSILKGFLVLSLFSVFCALIAFIYPSLEYCLLVLVIVFWVCIYVLIEQSDYKKG